MPGGHDLTIEVSNIMSFVLYTQILKQSILKPDSQGITLTTENLDGYLPNLEGIKYSWQPHICIDFWAKSA